METRKIITLLSMLAGMCILTMFLVTLFTSVAQEPFELVQPVDIYTKKLIAAEGPLRAIFTVDFIFITIFITLFIYLTQYLKGSNRVLNAVADVSLAAMFICGFLDYLEDIHILTMLRSATNGIVIEQSDISSQMLVSTLKFVASYLSMFLLAFVLPDKTAVEKLLKYSLWFVLLPAGVLVYTSPENLHQIFNLIRFVFMISGFFLLAYIFSKNENS